MEAAVFAVSFVVTTGAGVPAEVAGAAAVFGAGLAGVGTGIGGFAPGVLVGGVACRVSGRMAPGGIFSRGTFFTTPPVNTTTESSFLPCLVLVSFLALVSFAAVS